MEETMLGKLKNCGVDVDSALDRFMGNEALYVRFLRKFNEDKNFNDLKSSMESRNYMDAFKYGHTLKGVAGNLGLTPIYEKVSELVDLLRHSDNKTYSEAEILNMDQMLSSIETIYKQLYEIIAEQ